MKNLDFTLWKVFKTINSCQTDEQLQSVSTWVNNLFKENPEHADKYIMEKEIERRLAGLNKEMEIYEK